MLSLRRRRPMTTGVSCCTKAVDERLSTWATRRMGPGLRQDDEDGVCAPCSIRFSNSTREAFEVTSPRSSRGEVEICGSEFRVRGSLRERDAWIEPLTPPSPRKNGAREKKRHSFAISPQLCARFDPEFPASQTEGAGKAGCPPHPRSACNKKARGRTTGQRRIIRHSLRDGFTAYIALSPGTGLFCPRHFAGANSART